MMTEILQYHVLALIIGYALDLIIGDPHNMPHPIRLIGRWITFVEQRIYKDKKSAGFILVLFVVIPVAFITAIIMVAAFYLGGLYGKYIPILVESVLTFYCLATKSLIVESKAVTDSLKSEGIIAARKSLSMIVGRDTENLTEEEVIKATVETIAENTSDGVIAPLLYLCLGGPILGLTYKACNTMDSMVGYKNERYYNFGFFAAKLDDVLNFIPSRISAIIIVIAAFTLKGCSGVNAFKIWRRDNRNHKSPNSAQSEAAYAGALKVRLAGGAYYFGKWVDKPTIGDEIKAISIDDVKMSHLLLLISSILGELICTVGIFLIIK